MSNVVFESEENSRISAKQTKVSGLTGWLIKHSFGLIKTERGANVAMLTVALVFFGLSLFILLRTFA